VWLCVVVCVCVCPVSLSSHRCMCVFVHMCVFMCVPQVKGQEEKRKPKTKRIGTQSDTWVVVIYFH
jgi:hypothetical protein